MPVLIIDNNGTTSVTDGKIKKEDLENMKGDFISDVNVASQTRPIYKHHAFYFSKHQFTQLFNTAGAEFVKINIAVHLPGTTTICDMDLSDALSIVVELAEVDAGSPPLFVPISEPGNSVLINGYQDNEMTKFADKCCPSSDPTNP